MGSCWADIVINNDIWYCNSEHGHEGPHEYKDKSQDGKRFILTWESHKSTVPAAEQKHSS